MQKLLDLLCDTCSLGEKWDKGRVTSISLKQADDGTGVVITGQLKNDEYSYVVVVNSPYLKPDMQGQRDKMTIKSIQAAARNYLDSLPKQGELL